MNQIKHFRKQLQYSVYELAKRTDLTPSYISNLENHNRTNPSKEAMERISAALEKSVAEVFFPVIEEKTLEGTCNLDLQ